MNKEDFEEGTVGVVWIKDNPRPEISVHVWKRRKDFAGTETLSWGPTYDTEHFPEHHPTYQRLVPAMALMHNPSFRAEAFYFTPEEYKALMEGP